MFNTFNLIAPVEAVLPATSGEVQKASGSGSNNGGTDFMSYLAAVMSHVESKEKLAAETAKVAGSQLIDGKNLLVAVENQEVAIDSEDQEFVATLEALFGSSNAESEEKDDEDEASHDTGASIGALEAAIQNEVFQAMPEKGEAIRPVAEEEAELEEESAEPAKNSDGAFHPEIVSATFYSEGQRKQKMPTAEEYIARYEEFMKTAAAVTTARVEIYTESEESKSDEEEQSAAVSAEAAGSIFESSDSEYLAVLPSKEAAISEMAIAVEEEALADDGTEAAEPAELLVETENVDTELEKEFLQKEQKANTEIKDELELLSDLNVDEIDVEIAKDSEPAKETRINKEKEEAKAPEVKVEQDVDVDAQRSDKQVAEGRQAQHKGVTATVNDAVEKQNTAKEASAAPINSQPKVDAAAESAKSGTNSNDKNPERKEFVNVLDNTMNKTQQQQPQAPLAESQPEEAQLLKYDDTEPLQTKSDRIETRAAEPQQPTTRASDAEMRWQNVRDVQELTRMVQQAAKDGATKLTVRLTPEHLGRLEIQLTEIGGRIDAKILASSNESRAVLASHGDVIRAQLLEKGIHIDNMDFSFHDSLARQNQNDLHKQHKQSRSGNHFAGNNGDGDEEENIETKPVETKVERGAIYA